VTEGAVALPQIEKERGPLVDPIRALGLVEGRGEVPQVVIHDRLVSELLRAAPALRCTQQQRDQGEGDHPAIFRSTRPDFKHRREVSYARRAPT
jgi:hypothetical protein